MNIKKFFDESLSHLSYAVESKNKIVVVDPGRNPAPYLKFSKEKNATIDKIILTHTHADFVGSHLELKNKTGADILCHPESKATFEHISFQDKDQVKIGAVNFLAYDTPGHSRDSISVLISDENGKQYGVFTGDTLFVGDVGRPDIPVSSDSNEDDHYALKDDLSRRMYDSIRRVFYHLDENVLIFPTHSGGSLCGSNISEEKESTLRKELDENWALQTLSQDEFVDQLLKNQPHVPAYFIFDRQVNRNGAEDYQVSLGKIPKLESHSKIDSDIVTVDVRPSDEYQNNHLRNSINLMLEEGFETWLGTFVKPHQSFYLTANTRERLDQAAEKICKIGYEDFVEGSFLYKLQGEKNGHSLDQKDFKDHSENYTILDVRSSKERDEQPIFNDALQVPLNELPAKAENLHLEKPVVVHCSGGYRSAIATSILLKERPELEVFDLGEEISQYK